MKLCKYFIYSCIADGVQCISFKPDDPRLYLVGTELGRVYFCTTQYGSEFLATFPAHHSPVYSLQWNSFIPDIFLSCGADWEIKIWDIQQHSSPLFIFDLAAPLAQCFTLIAPYRSLPLCLYGIRHKMPLLGGILLHQSEHSIWRDLDQ